ncbi:TPA: hypothetical protein IYA97_003068, partial [Enterococcus faecium]|nr:hypothetical protein [Enterococcus faecium]
SLALSVADIKPAVVVVALPGFFCAPAAIPSNLVLSVDDINPFAVVVATAVVVAFIPGSPLSPFGKTKLNLAADDVPTFVTEAVEPLETVPMVIVAAWPG